MQNIKKYLNPFLISGILILIVGAISWFVFPSNQSPSGTLWLTGQVFVGVFGLVDAVYGVYKTWKDLKNRTKKQQLK